MDSQQRNIPRPWEIGYQPVVKVGDDWKDRQNR